MVNDDDSQVRVAAITTLAHLQERRARPPGAAASAPRQRIAGRRHRRRPLKGLGVCPIPGLLYALRSPDLNVSAAAIDVVGAIGEQDAVPDLIKALDDVRKMQHSSQRVCDLAAEALEKIDTPEAITALMKWRKRQKTPLEKPPARHKTARRAGGNLVVLTDLIESLHVADWEQRQEAAKLCATSAKICAARPTPSSSSASRVCSTIPTGTSASPRPDRWRGSRTMRLFPS